MSHYHVQISNYYDGYFLWALIHKASGLVRYYTGGYFHGMLKSMKITDYIVFPMG